MHGRVGSGGASRLRVALDTTYAGVNPTGVGLYSRRLAEHLSRLEKQEQLRLRCFGPACGPESTPTMRDLVQEWPPYTHGVLPARLLGFRPDLVHSTSHIGPLWRPGKLVVTVHDLIFLHDPQDYPAIWLAVTRLLLPLVLKSASAIIVDSGATRADIQRFFPGSKKKVQVIYPGFDRVEGSSNKQAQHSDAVSEVLTGNKRYILAVGPWSRRKNLPVVLRAFETLRRDVEDVALVITGTLSGGMKGAAVDELIAGLPEAVRPEVHSLGFVGRDALYDLMRGASLLAYPSRIEGFGLPPLEAMSLGVPVVTSNAPVLLEVTGDAALHAPPESHDAWAAAFRRVLLEPRLAQTLSEKGLERSSRYSWERCAAEVVGAYRQVASDSRVR